MADIPTEKLELPLWFAVNEAEPNKFPLVPIVSVPFPTDEDVI